MPKLCFKMKTRGGTMLVAKVLPLNLVMKKTSSILHETKSSIRRLHLKQKNIVLVKTKRIIVQLEKNVYGMRFNVTNLTVYGVG